MDKIRILVVDDDESIRFDLIDKLSAEENPSYDVVASTSQEAIEFIQGIKFDLVITDIKFTKMDDYEMVKFVKKVSPVTKVIVLTAYADLRHNIESKKLGAKDFISKPYDWVDFLTTIERVLRI